MLHHKVLSFYIQLEKDLQERVKVIVRSAWEYRKWMTEYWTRIICTS